MVDAIVVELLNTQKQRQQLFDSIKTTSTRSVASAVGTTTNRNNNNNNNNNNVDEAVHREKLSHVNSHLVSCFATLNVFCRASPKLLAKQASFLQPYLRHDPRTEVDNKILSYVASILELSLEFVKNQDQSFFVQLETALVRCVQTLGTQVGEREKKNNKKREKTELIVVHTLSL
jgi:hypothetical protein